MDQLHWRAALLGAALVAALGASAATGYEHGMMLGLGDERRVSRLVEELDVDASQAEEIRATHIATADATAADRERLQVLRDELRNLRDDFDPGEAQKLADEIGEITSRLVYEMTAMRASVRAVLNADQREQLDTLLEAHGSNRQRKSRWHDQG